jgi:AraC family transcriptional regulator
MTLPCAIVDPAICSAGPGARPFEEEHARACIALITRGTFIYDSALGTQVMAPGGILLGNCGCGYQCRHDHSWRDHSIAFHYSAQLLEQLASAVPGVRATAFDRAALPPSESFRYLTPRAEAALNDPDPDEAQEIALSVAECVLAVIADGGRALTSLQEKDKQRVAGALRWIESDFASTTALDDLAANAGVTPFHFLRIFRDSVGMTPLQYVLRTRLSHAAIALRKTDTSISAIALDCGFNDLSNFHRRFIRVLGQSPGAWRAALA